MDRRSFFTQGAGKVAKSVTRHAEEKARDNATRWIRPPFAIEELDLLIGCSRCGDCITACPHNIIFPLSSKLGVKVFNTPAMDLNSHGCHLCEDWPCVQACEKDVLKLPESTPSAEAIEHEKEQEKELIEKPLPKISIVTINKATCLPYNGPECGACKVCPVDGAMTWSMERPNINTDLCTGCALCREACIVEPKAINIQSIYEREKT